MSTEDINPPAELEERLRFETLIADLSSKFVNLPADLVDRAVEDAQRRVCECLSLELSGLWQWSADDPDNFTMTHLYRPLGGPPVPKRMSAYEHFPWCLQQVRSGNVVKFRSLDELPASAARDREVGRHYGIKSGLLIPLAAGGQPPFGGLVFNTVLAERTWTEDIVSRLMLVAQVFANALARKVADQALRESEERLSLAAEAAGAGLWELNLGTGRFWVTSLTRELFEFTADELVTFDRFLGVIHPEDRERIRQTVQATVQAKSESQVEYRIVRSDGSQRWMLSLGRVHCGKSGQPETLTGISMDITSRKAVERARSDNEARLAAAIEVAALGFYDMSPEPKVLFVDDRLCAILGLPDEERHRALEFWREHLHPDDRPRIMELSQRAWRGELGGVAMEYRYLHPQRGTIWLSQVSRVQEQAADGRVMRRLGVFRDITEQRHAELEANRLREVLAHSSRVTVLGQLVSALAHELGQPLGAILRNAEAAELMLQSPSPDLEELRAIVSDILSDDQRAGKVIDRLRSMLKRRSVEMQSLDLAAVIGEVLALIQADAAARHVSLVHSPSPGLPRVRGDRIQLQQVLLNLLINGMDALTGTPLKDRCIHVSAQTVAAGLIEVQVRDNGPGLASGLAERVFDPFFTTKPSGMGMGLAVSRTIVEAHQGKIWADNHPEGGACFHFTLPEAGGEGLVTSGMEWSGE